MTITISSLTAADVPDDLPSGLELGRIQHAEEALRRFDPDLVRLMGDHCLLADEVAYEAFLGFRDKDFQNRFHGFRSQKDRFQPSAGPQDPVRKHIAAFIVRTELYLVDREEIDRPVERHRLDSAEKIAGGRRDDFFFAGYQGDVAGTDTFDNAVIIFASQQS